MRGTVVARAFDRRAGPRLAVRAAAVLAATALAAHPLGSQHDAAGPPRATAAGPEARLTSQVTRRPFEHQRHDRVSCRACHGTGPRHRTILVRTARDCAGCHHDASRGGDCLRCHARADLPPAGRVGVLMALSVGDSARVRDLPFDHAVHRDAACGACHATPVTLAPARDCGSCHERHHRPEASCSSCHARVARDAHDARAHLSCAGAGCHASAVAPPPALSRSLCLTCHEPQRDHEPGRACAACHEIPDAPVLDDGASPSRQGTGTR